MVKSINENIFNTVKILKNNKKLTGKDIAQALQISVATVGKINRFETFQQYDEARKKDNIAKREQWIAKKTNGVDATYKILQEFGRPAASDNNCTCESHMLDVIHMLNGTYQKLIDIEVKISAKLVDIEEKIDKKRKLF